MPFDTKDGDIIHQAEYDEPDNFLQFNEEVSIKQPLPPPAPQADTSWQQAVLSLSEINLVTAINLIGGLNLEALEQANSAAINTHRANGDKGSLSAAEKFGSFIKSAKTFITSVRAAIVLYV
ncbi:MAG: hypothetical protein NT007_09890 [Candidatus Kapabacteria bacterium]|nr:hypothetical protein [Candidatus Kapabacteria bacterium]